VEIPSLRYLRLRSFTYLLISGLSGKCSMRFEHLCVPSPDWLVGAFGVRESLDGRPAAPVQAVGKESETGADVNGRGRSSSVAVDPVVMMVAQRGRTQLRAFS